jgi:sirohydrochlorin ferrochelatase
MDANKTAIILFAHGSAIRDANEKVSSLALEIGRRAGVRAIAAFLEIAQPDLASAVSDMVSKGARRIVVIPYFLTMGVHVSKDLPRLIEEQRAMHPGTDIIEGRSLEGAHGLADLVLSRVREALPEGKLF